MGLLLRDLGRVAYQEGDYPQAVALLEESLALLEQLGNKHLLNYTLLALGEVTRLQGDDEQAAAYYRRSLTLHRKRGAVLEVADRFEGLTKVAGRQGQPERAARLFGAAQALREQLGTPLPPIDQADYDCNLTIVRAALGEGGFSMSNKYSCIFLILLVMAALALTGCGQVGGSSASNSQSADAVAVVRGYYDAFNKKQIDQAVTYIADDARFINPTGDYTGKAQIREHLQGIANEGLSFDLSQFKNDNGRVTYAYKVLINGELVEEGDGGLTIVKNGKIVFDGTVETDPGQ